MCSWNCSFIFWGKKINYISFIIITFNAALFITIQNHDLGPKMICSLNISTNHKHITLHWAKRFCETTGCIALLKRMMTNTWKRFSTVTQKYLQIKYSLGFWAVRFCWCWPRVGLTCPNHQNNNESRPHVLRSVWEDCMPTFSVNEKRKCYCLWRAHTLPAGLKATFTLLLSERVNYSTLG